jgi:hypothetical protein
MLNELTVPIVSHGHGKMVVSLVERLMAFPEISCVLLTLNVMDWKRRSKVQSWVRVNSGNSSMVSVNKERGL